MTPEQGRPLGQVAELDASRAGEAVQDSAFDPVQDFEAGLRDTQPRNRARHILAALERRGIPLRQW